MSKIQTFLNNISLLSIVAFIGGGLLTAFVNYIRNRLRTLEYKVDYERVAVAASDSTFGNVRVTWQENEVQNLFVCTAILENSTTKDFSDLKIKVYTGDTIFLTQYVQIVGTSYVPNFTDEYKQSIAVLAGQNPTQEQFNIYNHNREFLIPVFNREQKFVIQLLVTAPNNKPFVCMDILHAGVKLKYKPTQNNFLGVPINITLPIGVGICFTILTISTLYLSGGLANVLCMFVGFFAQLIAAILYRTLKKLYSIFLG